MSHDDDAGADVLARIDLHAWHVPPPPAGDRSAILARVLAPAAPSRRPRVTWMLVALAIANVVLAAIVVIVISQRSPQTITIQAPAGRGDVDARTQELLRRLEQEQRELVAKLADVQQLHTVVEELSERVRRCEQADRSIRPEPKPRREPPAPGACDEVSCVLTNFEGACCAKLRSAGQAPNPSPRSTPSARALPDTLDRDAITEAIASLRAQVQACGQRSTAKGNVKVRVRVSPGGRVETVQIESTPDPTLGACVASVIQSAIFEPTHHGGAFSYPFVFGASP